VAVYLVGLLLLGLGLRFLVPPIGAQLGQVVERAPEWIDQGERTGRDLADIFYQTAPPRVQEQVDRQVRTMQDALERNATAYVQRAGEVVWSSILTLLQTLTFLFGFFVIPFFLFFTLLSSDRLPATVDGLLHHRVRTDVWNIWRIIDRIFGTYIRSQAILGLIVGAMTFAGLWLLRLAGIEVPYIFLLAVIAGFGELIPVIGPILSAIPAMIVVTGDGWSAVLIVALLYFVIQQIESQALVPRIVGTTLRLNPAVLLALIVIAAASGGLLLVIFAAPLAAIGRDIFIYTHRRLREPAARPDTAIADLVAEPDASDQTGSSDSAPGAAVRASRRHQAHVEGRQPIPSRRAYRRGHRTPPAGGVHARTYRLVLARERLSAMPTGTRLSFARAAHLLGLSERMLRTSVRRYVPGVAGRTIEVGMLLQALRQVYEESQDA